MTYSSVNYFHRVVHYILVLIYLVTGSFTLTIFIQFSHVPPLTVVTTNPVSVARFSWFLKCN